VPWEAEGLNHRVTSGSAEGFFAGRSAGSTCLVQLSKTTFVLMGMREFYAQMHEGLA